jgi:polyhydroxyalkanoate synthesis regulator phasin
MRNGKVFLVAATLLASPALFAQQPAPTNPPMQMPPGHTMQMPMQGQSDPMPPMDCQAMMDKMHASSKAMDERLATVVDAMNKAKGSAKVDRMAAVINEMVAQRKQMRDDMEAMMPQMMNHMMQHMQSGMMSGMKSMASCPMMGNSSTPTTPAPPTQEHKH